MPLHGHFWTSWPTVADRLRATPGPPSVPWRQSLLDPDRGEIALSGALHETGSRTCLVLVHGLGGDQEAPYCKNAARAAANLGVSSLRFCLRGADLSGQDFYHAGLVEDLSAALASDALQRYDRLVVLGFSLGGHIALRYALAPDDARVQAVAAVCPPLDLGRTADALHRRRSRLYERVILTSLINLYAQVERQSMVPVPLARVRQVRSIREWDSLTVAPRFGFRDVDDYYAQMSVGPRLRDLSVRSLILHSTADPMVPASTYGQFDEAVNRPATTWVRTGAGGHVGFPRGLDLGLGFAATSMEDQAVRFLLADP